MKLVCIGVLDVVRNILLHLFMNTVHINTEINSANRDPLQVNPGGVFLETPIR